MSLIEWFCRIIKEVREHFTRLDSLEEALGCSICENMYGLPEIIMDYIEAQSGKVWPDEVWDKILNGKDITLEEIWDEIERLEV